MASTSETGHAKNVANFKTLINSVTGMGEGYRPSDDALRPDALNTLYTSASVANSAVKDPLATYNRKVSERSALYKPLSKLVTRLLAMFNRSKAEKQVKSNAKTIADKIRGTSKRPSPTPPPAEGQPVPDAHSTSQQSFVMRADNFETFIGILKAEPTYTPAETELQVATLEAMYTDMKRLNDEADVTYQALQRVRTARNKVLYALETGLVDVAAAVKEYVKAAFGTGSTEYKGISGLKFTRIGDIPG